MAIRDGGAKFGVQGTPTFFINGELFDGERTIEAFRAKIDPLLQ
jgi:protein-disulfide isomerase